MISRQLITNAQNTWCPGCGNFSIQHALKDVFTELEADGISLSKFVLVTGIGCHAKIADYFNINSFYAIHGRTIPVATGIKIANPDLRVICCAGDGDAYAEGLDHLIFGAKRNIDITVIVHNNRVYGLTTGQYTPTSPIGFKGRSTPTGTFEYPLNPLELMLTCRATYVARGYSRNMPLLKKIIKDAILHRGFSFIDILQICATYFDTHDIYDRYVYELTDHDMNSYWESLKRAGEWDYNTEGRIPLGIFYQKRERTFDERFSRKKISINERLERLRQIVEEHR